MDQDPVVAAVETLPQPSPLTLESLAAEIKELQAQNMVLYHTSLEQKEEIETLKQQLAVHTSISTLPKLASPEKFDGTTSKAQGFLNDLLIYFDAREPEFKTISSKVYFATSLLKDKAKTWVDTLLGDGEKHILEVFPNFLAFQKAFKARFSDPLEAENARITLKGLKQGTGTVQDYVESFEQYQDRTGYDDVALIEIFEEGLLSSIAKAMYTLQAFPTSLDGWKMEAKKLDIQRLKKNSKEKQTTTGKPALTKPWGPKPPTITAPSSTPQLSTGILQNKTPTGMVYGGAGQPMDRIVP